MTKRCYTLSTTDPEAFRRLVDAAANLGTFSMAVVEVKEPTPVAKASALQIPPPAAPR